MYIKNVLNHSVGWEFEMQASITEKNKVNMVGKCLQVCFITNIQNMLECFVSLYELRNSSLLEVFLRPSSQFEFQDPSMDVDYDKIDSVCIKFECIFFLHVSNSMYLNSSTLHLEINFEKSL